MNVCSGKMSRNEKTQKFTCVSVCVCVYVWMCGRKDCVKFSRYYYFHFLFFIFNLNGLLLLWSSIAKSMSGFEKLHFGSKCFFFWITIGKQIHRKNKYEEKK